MRESLFEQAGKRLPGGISAVAEEYGLPAHWSSAGGKTLARLLVSLHDHIGGLKTQKDLQNMLQNWIGEYVLKSENASEDAKAKKPLSDARIEVEENPRAPGQFQCVGYLKPHFQLDAIDFSLRLVADVPD